MFRAGPLETKPDAITQEVLDLVARTFGNNFGTLDPFWYATDRAGALQCLDHFITHHLAKFGDYQDAMLNDDRFLHHSLLALYINTGLLTPLEVCTRVAHAYDQSDAPINAVEGFIRQIIGWREYIRGIYFLEGRDYTGHNALGHTRDLPAMYWGGQTRMNCMAKSVDQTRSDAYAHHIQRLMVTGNFALLAGIDPHHVHEWYLSVYMDAYEWVEAPNTIGMSQFADGGIVASKPYVSGGAYINRMSDYCKSCDYKISHKTGQDACPFNLLYWHFLNRHRDRFAKNPRMAQMYRTWDKMDADRKATVLSDGDAILARLDQGQTV
ncbi:MAG: cryptochrome/photolyase family protein, partial [Pseudomonadota bacterium]